ncbi:hypothetical protein RZS08_60620, partial [Arthrospira platensis SPKY1]|nr:hypothetical protein [Arthrospira platensis SPKY1]
MTDPEERALAEKIRIPVINFSNRNGPVRGCTNVLLDDAQIGALAADHLIKKGFRAFTSIGHLTHSYARERAEGFRIHLKALGYSAQLLDWKELDPSRNPLE